jgi:hypothetical protein
MRTGGRKGTATAAGLLFGRDGEGGVGPIDEMPTEFSGDLFI